MIATDVLIAHHDELRALMESLKDAEASNRGKLLTKLMTELSLHEQIEDEIFYPAMRDISTLVGVSHAEHRQLSDQLSLLLRIGPESNRFPEEFLVLKDAVEHHAGKEERDMFPEVLRKVSEPELEAIGSRLRDRLSKLRGSPLVRARLGLKRTVLKRL